MIARIKLYLAAFGFLLVAFVTTYLKGRNDSATAARHDQLKSEVDAHERINDADTGGGATDSERIKRLRDMAAQLRD
jgi:hypothetical protein